MYTQFNNSSLRNPPLYIRYSWRKCIIVVNLHMLRNWKIRTNNNKKTSQICKSQYEHNEAVHQLFIHWAEAYISLRREVLYNILFEFGIHTNLIRLIEMCLKETYSRHRVGNICLKFSLLIIAWKREKYCRHCFQTYLYIVPLGRLRLTRINWN